VTNDTVLSTLAVEIDMNNVYLPQVTLQLVVSSGTSTYAQPFLLEVQDCSVQVITVVGEPSGGPITRTLNKNQGLQSLFTAAEVATWFTVSDARPGCAIDGFLISAISATDFDTVFDTANYLDDGNINIVTDLLPVETPTATFEIFVTATHSANAFTDSVNVGATITVGCYDIQTISASYAANALYPFVFEDAQYADSLFSTLLQDGNGFKNFYLSQDLLTIETNQADCSWHSIEFVTDITGATLATDSQLFTFTEAEPEVAPANFLRVDTAIAFFGQLYFRVNSFNPEVFTVFEITVTNCVGLTISPTDGANEIFDIFRDQALVSSFESFDITGLFDTVLDGVIPAGKCPITDVNVCADDACATELGEANGFRVTNDTALSTLAVEIDMNIVYLPQVTLYL